MRFRLGRATGEEADYAANSERTRERPHVSRIERGR